MASRERPITLEFLADVAQYLRETHKAELTTEQLEDALVAVGNTGPELERKLSRAMKDAEKDVETLQRAVKELPDATDRAADSADDDFDRFARSADDAGDKVRTTLGETGAEGAQEFKSNLAETLASGGSPQELILGTIAGVIPGLGPIMAGAAAALAGIAGLIFRKVEEEKQRIEEMLSSFQTTLEGFYTQGIETATRAEKLQAFSDWIKDNTENIAAMKDEAADVGVEMDGIVAAALTGGQSYSNMVDSLYQIVEQETLAGGVLSERGKHAQDLIAWMDQIRDTTEDERTKQADIAEYTQATADAMALVDANSDGVVDATDDIAQNTDQTKTNIGQWDFSQAIADAERIDAKLRGLPTDIDVNVRAKVEWFAERSLPSQPGYSPGYAAISDMYMRKYTTP